MSKYTKACSSSSSSTGGHKKGCSSDAIDKYVSSKDKMEEFMVSGRSSDRKGAAREFLKDFDAKMKSGSKKKSH